MTSLVDRVCAALPHAAARALYARLRPGAFAHLQALRKDPDPNGYGLGTSERLGAIFVHVPKAAGISLCRSLFGNLAGGHTTLAQYRLLFEPEFFERAFKFAFVRNPWDRLHSAFHFLRAGGLHESDAAWARLHLEGYADFEDFVLRGLESGAVRSMVHFVPQFRFLCLPGRSRPGVDFLGRFENLEADYRTVRRRLGMDVAERLMHANRSRTEGKGDYRAAYTHAMRERVGRVYRRDIRMFGYGFE
jgi:hypothetical protein